MKAHARLLVVDDEPAQLDALAAVLREDGHEVVACADPNDALDELRRHEFDVLLCDLNMPLMDGITLTRRALEAAPDLVPVLMTGQGTIPTAIEAMKVGALDYVLKPFRLASMRPVLDRALEVRRLRTANRRLQNDVARRTRQLEAANRELDSFAARVAHDLRGPLHAMVGFGRVVRQRAAERLDEASSDYLQRIVTAGERADRMVNDLLSFARLGDRPLRRETVDLNEVLQRARQVVEPLAEGRDVRWEVTLLPSVDGDASLLEQVFVNLLSNALKYTAPRAHACIEVGHAPEPAGGHRIWVRDNGVGFDPAYAGRLFGPFQRLHAADEFAGHGIGLAHVKRIVERHGGAVGADGQTDRGATFTLIFPARRSAG